MALNSSGPISLAGSTAGQSIALELSQSATGTISLNDTAVRNLAGVPSGAITMPTNFWGKSSLTGYYGIYQNQNVSPTQRVTSYGAHFIDASNNCTIAATGPSERTMQAIFLSSNFTLSSTSYGISLGSDKAKSDPFPKPANTTTDHGYTCVTNSGGSSYYVWWGSNFNYANYSSASLTGRLFGFQHPNPIQPYTINTTEFGGSRSNAGINTAGTQGAVAGYFYNVYMYYHPKYGPQYSPVNFRWFMYTVNSSLAINMIYCTNATANNNGTTSAYSDVMFDTSGNIYNVINRAGSGYVDAYSTDRALLKFNSSLSLLWQKKLDTSAATPSISPTVYRLIGTDTSGNIYMYWVGSDGLGPFKFYIQKIDGSNGNTLWSKYYSLTYSNSTARGPLISINHDVLLVVAGVYYYGGNTARILRINISDGSVTWERTMYWQNTFESGINSYSPFTITNNGTNYVFGTQNNYGQDSMPYPYNMTVMRMPVNGAIGSGTSVGGVINSTISASSTTTVTDGNLSTSTSGFSFSTISISASNAGTYTTTSSTAIQYSKATF